MKNVVYRYHLLSVVLICCALFGAVVGVPATALADETNPYIKGEYVHDKETYIDVDAQRATTNPYPSIWSDEDIAKFQAKTQASGKHSMQFMGAELTFPDGSVVLYKDLGNELPGRHFNPVKIRVFVCLIINTRYRIGWHNQEFLNTPEVQDNHLINVGESHGESMVPFDVKINGFPAKVSGNKARFTWLGETSAPQYIEYSLTTPPVFNDLQIMPMVNFEEGGNGVSTNLMYMGARNGEAYGEFHAVDDFLYRSARGIAVNQKIPGRNAGLPNYSFAAHTPLTGLADLRQQPIVSGGYYSSAAGYIPTILRPEGEVPAYKENWKPSPKTAIHYYMLNEDRPNATDIALLNKLRPNFAEVTGKIDGYVYKDNDIDFPKDKEQFDATPESISNPGNQYLFVGMDKDGKPLRTKYYYVTYRPFAVPLEMSKVDADGKPLAGVEFEIYHNQDEQPMLTLSTDASGKIVLGDMSASKEQLEAIAKDDEAAKTGEKGYYEKDGKQWLLNGHTYTIKEKKPLPGYTKAEDKTFKADLGKTEGDYGVKLTIVNTAEPPAPNPGGGDNNPPVNPTPNPGDGDNNPPVNPTPGDGGDNPIVPAPVPTKPVAPVPVRSVIPTTNDSTLPCAALLLGAVGMMFVGASMRCRAR